MRDGWARLLKPDAVVLPAGARVWAQLVSFKRIARGFFYFEVKS